MGKSSYQWLVVEDDGDDFLLLKRVCARVEPKPTLHWVKDGMEAQHHLTDVTKNSDRNPLSQIQLILSDLNMPRMNGVELLAWVKSQHLLASFPLVIMTSSPSERDRIRARDFGASAYLVKPVTPHALFQLLQGFWNSPDHSWPRDIEEAG